MAENTTTTTSVQTIHIKPARSVGGWFSTLVIIFSIAIGIIIFKFVFGNPANFINNDPNNHPIEEGAGKWLGLFYKGGFLVPVAVGLLLMLIVFCIERLITLSKAKGTGNIDVFVQKIQLQLENDDTTSALQECDRQKGTIGNVIKEVLRKYREMQNNKTMDKENKLIAIQKALEEAIALELPMLEKHLVIIATIVSIATLVGLIGTVLGMIRAFAALATSGAPDAVALASGISEALVNTALGISTSTIATVAYNYFTSQIDTMTYKIDEAGFSIVQTFAEKN
ncbi:MAG: MotA/TolQ/ExbB proton channel family protein [Bacteroidia bacterium]|nr:MotA/TolQ/ExbB proton channel family protein [Bacteroidia bacterium]MDW8159524.1 MotA/TolQ/ExbB proton channel family protein [Bacteroidia bacterium]